MEATTTDQSEVCRQEELVRVFHTKCSSRSLVPCGKADREKFYYVTFEMCTNHAHRSLAGHVLRSRAED